MMLFSCSQSIEDRIESQTEKVKNSNIKVILSSELEWEKLNPARGDKSPQAATIWGDRNDTLPTGFLAKFVDGFSSPPHIHNVTYRAVVLKGKIHNDDPNAANMWMKPGSFWTQPAGESHITSARGNENLALVEIDKGPYLVKPKTEAFDNGEKPINIDITNVVWLNRDKSNWINSNSEAEISFLHKNKGLQSLFIKLPPSFKGSIISDGSVFRSVIIKGELKYILDENNQSKVLNVGSYIGSSGEAYHELSNPTEKECLIYIRTNDQILVD